MVVRNFLFHRVGDELDRLWPPMNIGLFRSIITYLKRNYQVVKLEDLLGNSAGYTQPGKRLATVLFDDGYKDNIEHAMPILLELDCPASFYVVTDCISTGIPTWTYLMDYYFQQTSHLALKLPEELPGLRREVIFHNRTERIEFGSRLKPALKKLTNSKRVEFFNAVQESFSDMQVPRDKMMNWDEVATLSAKGFEIGSHSASHPLLATIQDDNELKNELTRSADAIVRELGFFPRTISYPIGSYDNRVIEHAKAVGYNFGLAVEHRFYDTEIHSNMAIPRVELYNEPFIKARLRMTGIMQSVKSLYYGTKS